MATRACGLAVLLANCSAQQNPPVWPSTVRVFGPGDGDIQEAIDAAFANNGGKPDHGQFSNLRYAFLFKPGTYDVDVPVGYYTQVAGLGQTPGDVVFTSAKGVYCEEGVEDVMVGSLNTFWRSVENFHTKASYAWHQGVSGMLWAASQAAPVRRVSADNDLILFRYREGTDAADFASGGFLANSQVRGTVLSGSEQQFFLRNNEVRWDGGVWNMVFVGTQGAPPSHCGLDVAAGTLPHLSVEQTPTIAEKPFISIDGAGRYTLNVPAQKQNRQGVDWSPGTQIGFEQVYVADATKDSADSINAQLSKGMHVVLAPGIYELTSALVLNKPDQVLLGLGLATLIATRGQPAVQVGNVDGVRVAGVMIEAGSVSSDQLLVWGDGAHGGSAANPGVMSDVFVRVGGAVCTGQKAKTMIEINSGHVVGDNLWLWRADHCIGDVIVPPLANPCDVGLIVNGADVTMYGLFVEHTLQDLTQWNGENGRTYFYQSEMPYDVDQSYGDAKYVGYRVADHVATHHGYGIGVYHFFRDHNVVSEMGISVPSHLEASIMYPLSVYLNGKGTIKHVMNDKGSATFQSDTMAGAVPAWYCGGGPTPPVPTPQPSPAPMPAPSPVPMPSPSPTPSSATCNVGDVVGCPGAQGVMCSGDQCCPGGVTCPSAPASFTGCPMGKTEDCTGGGLEARDVIV